MDSDWVAMSSAKALLNDVMSTADILLLVFGV